jgi:hypothetical protein
MARRVIALLGGPPVTNEDDQAAEAITPGELVAYDGSGNLILNTEADENVARTFALERDELGNDIDVAYAIGDQVKVGAFHGGQRVYAWLASGENVAKGAYLTGDGAGHLAAAGANPRIARAVEAVNATAAAARIRVEIV